MKQKQSMIPVSREFFEKFKEKCKVRGISWEQTLRQLLIKAGIEIEG